jgi:hypothetical protein
VYEQAHTIALPSCGPSSSSSIDTSLVACYHLYSFYHPRDLSDCHEILRQEGHGTLSRLVYRSLARTPALPDHRLDCDIIHNRRTSHGSTSRPGSNGTSSPFERTNNQPVVAPDDLVTLSSWITFTWMNKFIAFGNSKEMQPEDLPPLSLTMQTSVIFHRFRDLSSSTLLRRILSANAIDLALDGLLTLCSVVFNYAGPFFLKRIL